jgi:hypothetical protein
MRYLSTVLFLAALAGFMMGFGHYLQTTSQYLASAKGAARKVRHHRAKPPPVEAGAALPIPVEEPPP